MNSQEFYLWLNGYLEALESEGITECKFTTLPSCFDIIFCDITNTSPLSSDVFDEDNSSSTISSAG